MSTGIYGLIAAVAVAPALIPAVRVFAPYTAQTARTVLGSAPRERSRRAFPPESEPGYAYRGYFFGPAMIDVRSVTFVGLRAIRRASRRLFARRTDVLRAHWNAEEGRWWATPACLVAYLYIAAGTAVAMAFGVLLGGLQAAGILAVQSAARAGSAVLRAADTALLRARGLNGMLCPSCCHRVEYPAYKCPSCSHLHADIRPGRYGVLRRRCACDGKPMRTLILLGSHRYPAFCTHCERSMSEAVGRSRELILPLFGGVAAGKTQLMAAMTKSLIDDPGRHARPADQETREAYDTMKEVFDNHREFRKTGDELPRAHAAHRVRQIAPAGTPVRHRRRAVHRPGPHR
jgi:hypothetical protein